MLSETCWTFEGPKVNGYGVAWVDGVKARVHRAAYEVLVGPIPDGLVLDHICRNRACYNPAHLEPVTTSENLRRSPLMGRAKLSKTHCPAGHPYSGENLYTNPKGARICRACAAESTRKYRRK